MCKYFKIIIVLLFLISIIAGTWSAYTNGINTRLEKVERWQHEVENNGINIK